MSSSFRSWRSRTKQGGWVNLRFYLFGSSVNQVEWERGRRREGGVEYFLLSPQGIENFHSHLRPAKLRNLVEYKWRIRFWDSVGDSDTGEPSSVTIKIEYLLAFQWWYCEFCVENRWGGGRKHCFVLQYQSIGQKNLFRASWNRIFLQP